MPFFIISLSVCVSVCVTFVVFTDCVRCTRPTSANPGSMEAGEYGLTCGTCFVARRFEVVAVARLLSISWCVLSGADFLGFFSPSRFVFFSERTRPAASMWPPCLDYLSTRNEAVFLTLSQKYYSYRGAKRVSWLNYFCLSVCMCFFQCVCETFVVSTDCESCTRPISRNPESIEAGEYGPAHGTCFVARHLEVVAVDGLLCISCCVHGWGGFLRCFFS